MNELSPRRFPRSPLVPPKTPPQWKKPQDVMRERKIRLKQNALLARISRSPSQDDHTGAAPSSFSGVKRKNPFSKCKEFKEPSPKKTKPEPEVPTESSLLEILGFTESKDLASTLNANCLTLTGDNVELTENEFKACSFTTLPVDWTLRTKMRFISRKPFPWSQMLKTCEESSGITGFVRCLESCNERSGAGLDCSPNSRFHQNCLFWQHPHLPWLELYPRHNLKKADKSQFPIVSSIKDALHKDWSNSFRSIFQLVRARHCPYFYMVANSFACLFRAAGINGIGETAVYVCPTSGGFRKLLREEGMDNMFWEKIAKQRLQNIRQSNFSGFSRPSALDSFEKFGSFATDKDTALVTMRMLLSFLQTMIPDPRTVLYIFTTVPTSYSRLIKGINFSMPLRDDDNKKRRSNGVSENEEEDEIEGEQEEDERGETEHWLASLGIEQSEIGKIKSSEELSLLKGEDKNDDSLVLVEGSEVHALFNFLINCKSVIATTGPLAGIPPTLISPVAFTGGTLLSLKVRESTVKQDNERFYTMEVRGPILPNTVHNLCRMLQDELETYTVTFANVDFTKAYTVCKGLKELPNNSPSKQTRTFSMESLTDSGLDTKLLSAFCSDNLKAFDSLKCNGNSFMIL